MQEVIAATSAEKAKNILPIMSTAKSLLIIEDDLAQIQLLDAVLGELGEGLEWEYVTSGEAALALIRRRGAFCGDNPYSLVITDIFLEGELTGFDVWLDCQELYPDMPFVITSYLSFDRYFSILQGAENCPVYLPKPLTASRCQSILEEYF